MNCPYPKFYIRQRSRWVLSGRAVALLAIHKSGNSSRDRRTKLCNTLYYLVKICKL